MKRIVMPLLLLLCAAGAVQAGEASLDRGKELFESEKLGTNAKSCNACHPGGRKLEWAAASYDDEKMTTLLNKCIANALKGKPLPSDSTDMKSLIMYIRTFGGSGQL